MDIGTDSAKPMVCKTAGIFSMNQESDTKCTSIHCIPYCDALEKNVSPENVLDETVKN